MSNTYGLSGKWAIKDLTNAQFLRGAASSTVSETTSADWDNIWEFATDGGPRYFIKHVTTGLFLTCSDPARQGGVLGRPRFADGTWMLSARDPSSVGQLWTVSQETASSFKIYLQFDVTSDAFTTARWNLLVPSTVLPAPEALYLTVTQDSTPTLCYYNTDYFDQRSFTLNEDQFIVGVEMNTDNNGLHNWVRYAWAYYKDVYAGNVTGSTLHWVDCWWGTGDGNSQTWLAPTNHALVAVDIRVDQMVRLIRFQSANVTTADWIPVEAGGTGGGRHYSASYGNVNWYNCASENGYLYLPSTFWGRYLHGFDLTFSIRGGWGVTNFHNFRSNALPYYIATYISTPQCCLSSYPGGSGQQRACGYLATDLQSCKATLATYCGTGANFVTQPCQNYCQGLVVGEVACDGIGQTYCASLTQEARLAESKCGCFLTTDFYDTFFDSLYSQLPGATLTVPRLIGCTYPGCSLSTLKNDSIKLHHDPPCPNNTVCIQQINVTNNGTISALTIEQKALCGQSDTTTNTNTDTGTGTASDTSLALDLTTLVILGIVGFAVMLLTMLIVVYFALPGTVVTKHAHQTVSAKKSVK